MEPIQEQDLRRVVEIYSHMLLRVAMTRVPTTADAEDVVQDVFLRLMTHSPRFRDGAHEKAWLLRTAVNMSRRVTSATYRKKVVPLEAGENIPAAPFRSPEENQVWQAMQALPENYRLPIYLFYFEELSTDEIAKALSIRPGTARMRLSRGRDLLRELLKGEYFDE